MTKRVKTAPLRGTVRQAGLEAAIPWPAECTILDVRVHDVIMGEAMHLMEAMVRSSGSHHVVTVNPEFIMTARANEAFREVLNRADLAIPDGMGVVLASGLLGKRIRQRVTGVDAVEQFARIASKRGYRCFFLGAAPGVARRAADLLQQRYPGFLVAGTYAGSPRPEEEEEICSIIENAAPDALFVAYGSPHQDLWIDRTRERLRIPVSMGVGGALDFIAGIVPRAPRWMHRLGLEWLFRLIDQPARWRRMLALPLFAAMVLAQFLRSGRARSRDIRRSANTISPTAF